MCICIYVPNTLSVFTVEIGFRIDALTISESEESVEVCLNTLGTPLMDTTINVSVLYGSAREEGKMYNIYI